MPDDEIPELPRKATPLPVNPAPSEPSAPSQREHRAATVATHRALGTPLTGRDDRTAAAPSRPMKQTVIGGGTPRARGSKPRFASKSIYFSDEHQLSSLEKLIEQYPRSSVSSVVQQLVAALLVASTSIDPEHRSVVVTCRIHF